MSALGCRHSPEQVSIPSILGVEWGEFPMESVGGISHDGVMELVTTVGAIVAGVVMVLVGVYSIAAIIFDDLAQ